VWSSAGDGVQIFDKTGALIGKILVPEAPANLSFGGADGSKLFITARTSLYRIDVLARPAR
jgi:gluconolactonase